MRERRMRPWLEALLFVVAELVIFFSYQHSDVRFHWFLHFFVGATVALTALAVQTWRSARVLAYPLLWVLLGHALAMIPDPLFAIMPHQSWMDVFLLHISVHFIPGRNWAWYTLFLISLGGYLAARALVETRHGAAASAEHQRRLPSGPTRNGNLQGVGAADELHDRTT